MGAILKRADGHVYYVIGGGGKSGGGCECEKLAIDLELDTGSNNPIANSVVAAAIKELRDREFTVDSTLMLGSSNAVSNSAVTSAINGIRNIISGISRSGSTTVISSGLAVSGPFGTRDTMSLSKLSGTEYSFKELFTVVNALLGAVGAGEAKDLTTIGDVDFTETSHDNDVKCPELFGNDKCLLVASAPDTPFGIFKTTDGKKFTETSLTTECWSTPVWTGTKFVVAGADHLFESTDGQTWHVLADDSVAHPGPVTFAEHGEQGVLVTGRRISLDGGVTWSGISVDSTPESLPACIISYHHILVPGETNHLYRTVDAGLNWFQCEGLPSVPFATPVIGETGDGHRIVLAQTLTDDPSIYLSMDNGITWEEFNCPDGHYANVSIVGNKIFLSMAEGGIYAKEVNDFLEINDDTWELVIETGIYREVKFDEKLGGFYALQYNEDGAIMVSNDGFTWKALSYHINACNPTVFKDQVLFPTMTGDGIYSIPLEDFLYARAKALAADEVVEIDAVPEEFTDEDVRTTVNELVTAVNRLSKIILK